MNVRRLLHPLETFDKHRGEWLGHSAERQLLANGGLDTFQHREASSCHVQNSQTSPSSTSVAAVGDSEG